MNYMNTVQAANPDIVSSYSAGKSYESRDLKVLVIKTPTSKKSIWIGRKIIQIWHHLLNCLLNWKINLRLWNTCCKITENSKEKF